MAEIAVLLVLKKIAIALAGETLSIARPLLAKKSELVAALPVDMKLINNELELIQAFLKEIDRKSWKGEVIETWIGQVRRLAYDMEDIVDHFIYIVGKHNQKGSWWNYMKNIVKKPNSLFSLHEVATEIKTIKQELKQLSESRDRWTKPLESGTEIPIASYETEQELYLPGHDYSINDDELVGTDKSRQTLIDLLHSEDGSLQTIVVWGMGGIGKSTLVNNVYRNEISNFDCRSWVFVSQTYKLEDIWKKMLGDILGKDKKEFNPETMNTAEIIEKLKKAMDKKRYLIILDDVWTAKIHSRIGEVVVHNGRGSRVIITTRIEEVASVADYGYKIKIEPLNDHDAWLLFCRKAFPKLEHHVCPPDLFQCSKDIVEKCDGLPLALVAIGSLLSLKTRNDKEWSLFYCQFIWELHNNENLNRVIKILNLSYKYLPSYLKNCFLYCAIFPEDYLIHRKRLIRFWIAEGFIEQNSRCGLEDIAEGYLRELVQRSMLQVVERNSFDRIKCVRMHDLVRELAIFQSRKESFSTIYDGITEVVQLGPNPRRVSVFQCKNNDIRSSIDPYRLRTFIAFDTSMTWCSLIPSQSKYLAVLDLSGLSIEIIPRSVGELFNLRLLCLDHTNVKELPRSMTKLQNLQTLSLEHTQLQNFPQGFSKLKKLRYLLAWQMLDVTYRTFNSWEGVKPFNGLWNMNELQTLGAIKASEAFVTKLGSLSQLRSLVITDVRSCHCAPLCNTLSKMRQLSRLLIRACNKDELLQLDDLTLSDNLQTIELCGQLSGETLGSPFFLNHGNALLRIELQYSRFIDDPVPRLSELSKLTKLTLRMAYTGQQLYFQADWFPNLREINLVELPYVNQICIHEGALVSLECLYIRSLLELHDVPIGVKFLSSLKTAYFIDMHSDFARNIRAANLDCIPSVYLTTKDLL